MDASANQRYHFEKMEHGCKHYKRRCKLRAPCCNKIFPCRLCHDEETSALSNPQDWHNLPRHDVRQVVCLICDKEQDVAPVCANCGVNMGEYFCELCKFYDDDTKKGQFHCDGCGICRVGGRENFFHCQKCGSCYPVSLQGNHLCVENSLRHNCPICYEYLFDSLKQARILNCGHTMHMECFVQMKDHGQYSCPICSKSAIDMTELWQKMDEEVQATRMPEDYRHKKVWILCNDCSCTTEVFFHIVGHKCGQCKSYNTRSIPPPASPH